MLYHNVMHGVGPFVINAEILKQTQAMENKEPPALYFLCESNLIAHPTIVSSRPPPKYASCQ